MSLGKCQRGGRVPEKRFWDRSMCTIGATRSEGGSVPAPVPVFIAPSFNAKIKRRQGSLST